MKYKMIVTDLDRTLLTSKKIISEYAKNVLNRCHYLGLKIVLATARPKRTVMKFLDGIFVDSLILHNGAVIEINDSIFRRFGIEPNITKDILTSINKDYPLVTLSADIDDVLYANFDVPVESNCGEGVRTDFTNLPNCPADKITIGLSSPEDIKRYDKYLPNDLYLQMSESRFGLVMHQKATKWQAIKLITNYFGLSSEEIIAFGDDYNDIEMIRKCGVGVVVSNGLNEVKAVADDVCDSNDNDGVAKWLEEKIFNR